MIAPAPVDYLLIGHIAADLVLGGRILGGTVSYAARTAHAFGLRVGVLTSAAPDEPLLDELRQYAQVIAVPAAQTTTFENIYTPEGRKQYLRAMAAPIQLSHVPLEWLDTPLIHIAPITDDLTYHMIPAFSGKGRILITPQGWMRRRAEDDRVHFKRWFDPDILKHVDVVVFSEEDIIAAPDLEPAFAQAVDCCIVTRSDQGGTYYLKSQNHRYQAVEAKTVDPTGAGDIFAASFLAALHNLNNIDLAVQVAAIIAAHSITRVGLLGTPASAEVQAALLQVRESDNP